MKKYKNILCGAIAVCFSLLPLSACKKDNDGMTTLQINEVTHSVFYSPSATDLSSCPASLSRIFNGRISKARRFWQDEKAACPQ